MNQSVRVVFEIIENIKQNITDNQYKVIMDNLMVLNKSKKELQSNAKYIIEKMQLYEDVIYFIDFNYNMTYLINDDKLEIKNISYDYNKYKEQTDINIFKLPTKKEINDIIINHYKLKIVDDKILGLK
jgi:hypothetical protein